MLVSARLSTNDVRWCSMMPPGILVPDIETISMMIANWPSSSASTSRSIGIGTSGSRS
ncbi:Uncharacterised protein [Mycobacteroides abscessus subsp. abscessus]|nr:Uncharacterised protein [Mycobacteroides abscessus subsp. abscessus]